MVNASTYALGVNDQYLGITYNGSVAVALSAGTDNRTLIIKDERGSAATQPITITANGVQTIDGQSSVILAINHGSITLWYNSGWHII